MLMESASCSPGCVAEVVARAVVVNEGWGHHVLGRREHLPSACASARQTELRHPPTKMAVSASRQLLADSSLPPPMARSERMAEDALPSPFTGEMSHLAQFLHAFTVDISCCCSTARSIINQQYSAEPRTFIHPPTAMGFATPAASGVPVSQESQAEIQDEECPEPRTR